MGDNLEGPDEPAKKAKNKPWQESRGCAEVGMFIALLLALAILFGFFK